MQNEQGYQGEKKLLSGLETEPNRTMEILVEKYTMPVWHIWKQLPTGGRNCSGDGILNATTFRMKRS